MFMSAMSAGRLSKKRRSPLPRNGGETTWRPDFALRMEPALETMEMLS
jgi:hypothetical protein